LTSCVVVILLVVKIWGHIRGGITMKFNIKHDTKTNKFYTEIGGKESVLKYDKVNDYLYNLKTLFVPKNLRGQGIAGRLMEAVLSHAKKNMIKIKISCSYMQEYINKHLEYNELIFKIGEVVLIPEEDNVIDESPKPKKPKVLII